MENGNEPRGVIDDGVTSGAQFTNDFEFGGWFLTVCGRNMLCKPVRDETKRFAQERDSFVNDVALRKDILDVGGVGRVVLGCGRRVREVVRVMKEE